MTTSNFTYKYVYTSDFKVTREEVAATLANSRVIMFGGEPMANVLDNLPEQMFKQVMFEADNVMDLINLKAEQ
jgi:hypothetical protein